MAVFGYSIFIVSLQKISNMGKSTKRIVKLTGIILLVIVFICVTISITPTFGLQIPFNEWVWKHHPVQKIRYYMSDDLVTKLNIEKPNIEEVAELLGPEMMGGHLIQVGDKWVTYFLKTPPFHFMGLDMYTLDICFEEDGSFIEASVNFSD